jgi:DNA-binding LacI/PurR family transcriptional regulator
MIGVLVTELTSRNNPEILFQLGQEIQDTGNRMLVFTLHHEDDMESILAEILTYHVDGVISGATMPDEMLNICGRHRIPVVLYNRSPRSATASAVSCDHSVGMADLVDHLVEGGVRHAAFLAGPERAPVSDSRLAAARAALAEHGLRLEHVVRGDYSYESGRAVAGDLLRRVKSIDTLVCANDTMALGAIDACRHDLQLRVPEDVAVTGFDDIPQAVWPSYSLTTLRQPVRTMTRAAVRMLMEMISGDSLGSERRLMPAKLQIRQSTRRQTHTGESPV